MLMLTLTELCEEMNNWFEYARFYGQFEISDGKITSFNDGSILKDGQYFRIIGSVFNDGVHQYGNDGNGFSLTGEVFSGSVWIMAVPQTVIALANDIDAWRAKFEDVESSNMSPYNSESFGGYSYSKSGGGSGSGSGASGTWQSSFANRIKRYRRLGTAPRDLQKTADVHNVSYYTPVTRDEIKKIVSDEIHEKALEVQS